jgi:hypothetical protein
VCACNAGFYSQVAGGPCVQCPVGSWCAGGTQLQNCVANATSPGQSISPYACYCDRGYQGVNNTVCRPCLPGTWCWTGLVNTCPANSSSLALSSYLSNCSCGAGYAGPAGGPCSACLPGTFKDIPGDTPCLGCALNAFAPQWNSTGCGAATTCPAGWWADPVYSASSDNVCVICPIGSQCQANTKTLCPPPSVSPIGSSSYLDCSCPAGTSGVVTGPTQDAATCTPPADNIFGKLEVICALAAGGVVVLGGIITAALFATGTISIPHSGYKQVPTAIPIGAQCNNLLNIRIQDRSHTLYLTLDVHRD